MKDKRLYPILGVLATGIVGFVAWKMWKNKQDQGKADDAAGYIKDIESGATDMQISFMDIIEEIRSLSTGFKPAGWQPDEDVDLVRDAMFGTVVSEGVIAGIGTAEEQLKDGLSLKSRWQLKLIFDQYEQQYKRRLEDDIIKELYDSPEDLEEIVGILSRSQEGNNFNGFQMYSKIYS